MADAAEAEEEDPSEPTVPAKSKRARGLQPPYETKTVSKVLEGYKSYLQSFVGDAEQRQMLPIEVDYDDITAEVDRRMKQHELRHEHERKHALGLVDKRKRQSNDSFTIELEGTNDKEMSVKKPSKKKTKHRHSEQTEEL